MKRIKKLWWIGAIAVFTVLLCCISIFTVGAEDGAPALAIKANTLDLKNAVYMNFKVSCENVSQTEDVRLLVWEEYPGTYDKATADASLSAIRTETNTGYLVFQYDDLSAKEMTEFVYVCAYVNEDGVDIYSNPAKFSIVQYGYNTLTSNASAAELKAVVSSMLDYGAMAQTYFGHNTDFLANDEVAKVKVVNGTHTDGFKTGYYKAGSAVTVTANAPVEGQVFSHWTNAAGQTVGTESTLTIPECVTDTYTAVYSAEITEPAIVVSEATASAGEAVSVTVAFENSPGVSSAFMKVAFDDQALALESMTYNTAIGGTGIPNASSASPVTVYWADGFNNVTGDFTLVTLNFRVSAQAAPGDYAVTVSYNPDDIFDANEDNVAFEIVNGVITVS